MKKKNRKSGPRSVSPPGFSFVLLGDHLSAGHLVRQIEMWLPFFQKEFTIRHRTAFRSVYLPCIKIVFGQLSPYRPSNLCQKFSS